MDDLEKKENPEVVPPPLPPVYARREGWLYSVWFVLLALFFLLGPLGLPLLWKSPKFPRWSKIALTLFMVLMVGLFFTAMVRIATTTLDRYQQMDVFFQ
jgi:hypothetical protein